MRMSCILSETSLGNLQVVKESLSDWVSPQSKSDTSNGTTHSNESSSQLETSPSTRTEAQKERRRRQRRKYMKNRAAKEGRNRTRKLNRIYIRDKATCWHCGLYVPREEASREHVYPIRYYPELARDINNQVLSHKRCNL